MEAEKTTLSTVRPPTPESVELAKSNYARAHVQLPFDIKTAEMNMFLITEDRLDGLREGSQPLEFTFFGLFLGIAITLVGIAISLYYAAATSVPPTPLGALFVVVVGLAILFLLVATFYGIKGHRIRRDCNHRFRDIKEKSATIVTLAPKENM